MTHSSTSTATRPRLRPARVSSSRARAADGRSGLARRPLHPALLGGGRHRRTGRAGRRWRSPAAPSRCAALHHQVEHPALVELGARAPRARPGPRAPPAPGRPGRAPRAPRWTPARRRRRSRPAAGSARRSRCAPRRRRRGSARRAAAPSTPPAASAPSTTFCWLPPESVRTGRVGSAGRTSSCAVTSAGRRQLGAAAEEARPGEPAQRGQRDVAVHRLGQQQALALALLRAQAHAGPHRRRHRARRAAPRPRRDGARGRRGGRRRPSPGSPSARTRPARPGRRPRRPAR